MEGENSTLKFLIHTQVYHSHMRCEDFVQQICIFSHHNYNFLNRNILFTFFLHSSLLARYL